jgi:thiol-disulfide isomerase/thioredoxin
MKIIKITSLWCPSCIIINETLNELKDQVEIITLDYYFDHDEVIKYNPGKILPVLIFLDKNNQELERLIGEQSKKTILNLIESYNSR